ncbi:MULTISPECIES: helix-turn-helix domain-containing protein [Streptomycetaceae]|uniref:DNA-binding protein n=1 Tax=Streptantibioticus cattleyicolor (strain ATCC 35852 / DSM 46488 / JCM 4925 / NBRC 14057 / NRRL 8057) TaxID=1003195 RepID=F8JXF8_STREN|nr:MULTISPECIES: helix-turn-helix transcriptional regulator [Streptomycetaceae]AEW95838.1 DNA-binding protein [Streptantibioticus cattleyicolor NRRL 8057 = DSM 46488]MYS60381.1 helix-turn-helix domain-containing protein [Streptomyces sp. SID5468]CCB76177.1 putative DNA-binding protein [Streptantibioticus cattleyicolor NRRL 8057 = DSM 46488]
MGLRANPTQRQRRLGAELRRLRETSGMSATDAGALAGLGRAHMSHIEMGRTAIPEEKLRLLAHAYGCKSPELVDALVEMAQSTGKGWWTEFRDTLAPTTLDFAELEASAEVIKTFTLIYVPGLLQTEEYMRALFEIGVPEADRHYIERGVEFRLRRGRLLLEEEPPQYYAVVHEAALHMTGVGRDVLVRQIEHLLELAQLPHVNIQIIPFRERLALASESQFSIYEPAVPQLGTIHLESPAATLFLTEPHQLTRYNEDFDNLRQSALPPLDPKTDIGAYSRRDSLGFVQHMLYTL